MGEDTSNQFEYVSSLRLEEADVIVFMVVTRRQA